MGAHLPSDCNHGKRSEQGFVLLAALWLLLLVGTIGAFLMARSLQATKQTRADEVAIQERLSLQGAIDTVVAEAVFNGPRSRWYRLPAAGSVEIGGKSVSISITPENGRLDLNETPLELVDDLFRGLGASAAERLRLRGELEARRSAGATILSLPESVAMLRRAGIREPGGTCLADLITTFTALPAPRLELAPDALRDALSRAGQEEGLAEAGGTTIGPTEPVRIVATVGDGRQLNVVLRLVGASDRPYMVHHWSERPLCERA